MSDFFTFRDSLEPTASSGLQSTSGGGAGAQETEDLVGFDVEATDGSLGKVSQATYGPGESYLIVETGGTLLSKNVVLPAGVVERIDRDGQRVHVNRTKDEIKDAPAVEDVAQRDPAFREQLAGYYGRGETPQTDL